MIAGVVASQQSAVFAVTPNFWQDSSPNNPVTSPNSNITVGGTLYFEISSDYGDGFEIEYSINNGNFNYIYVTGAGYVSSQSISVSDGDTVKFQVTKYGSGYVGFDLKNTNTSGATLFTGIVEQL